MKIHNDLIQWTPEWFEVRKGKMTASHAQAIWNVWKWLDSYIVSLMSEYYSSAEKEQFSSSHTDRGNELEPLARDMYELTKWVQVEQVWFIEYSDFVWCSPDWFIWEDWWIEIKSVQDLNHFELLLNWESEIESKYIWQIQMNLLITGRKWWDYVSYNPNYTKSLIIFRIYPDEKKFEKLKEWFEYWEKKILEIKSKVW